VGDRSLSLMAGLAIAGSSCALVMCNGESPPADRGRVPGPNAAVPTVPGALAERLSAADAALRRAVHAWRVEGQPTTGGPPDEVTLRAVYVQRVMRLLSRRPRLAASTVRRLSPRLAYQTRQLTAALRDLRKLSAGWPARPVRTGPPPPLGNLLAYYRAAQRRFGVRWQVLAAVNLVESAFGRVRSESVAGAQGPMQFIPATWRAYGLGGDVHDPRDAILGAANLLRQAGAPDSHARALYAYNPSPLFVEAVLRYARLIARDRDALYFLYSSRPGS
jgi:soluble lytic murein transglycosylase-like protein